MCRPGGCDLYSLFRWGAERAQLLELFGLGTWPPSSPFADTHCSEMPLTTGKFYHPWPVNVRAQG